MKTLLINKNNWSGDQAKIKIFKNKVSLYGVCGRDRWESFNIKINKRIKDFISFSVDHKDYGMIVTGYFNNGIWYAQANVQRESNCLYTAIAQVLFNIL